MAFCGLDLNGLSLDGVILYGLGGLGLGIGETFKNVYLSRKQFLAFEACTGDSS